MTRMTSSEAFVETLVAHGVKDVFGIVGSAYMDALDIFPAAGIRFISVAHEQGAGHMADGYSRVSNRPGCVHRAERTGHHQFRDRGRRGLLGAFAGRRHHARDRHRDDRSWRLPGNQRYEIFSKITKFQAHVKTARPNGADRPLLSTWRSPRGGRPQLNIPRDHFYGELDVRSRSRTASALPGGGAKSLDGPRRRWPARRSR